MVFPPRLYFYTDVYYPRSGRKIPSFFIVKSIDGMDFL